MNSFEFMPAIGYFVANNFALALSGTYSHSAANVYKSNELVLMPTILYYFPLASSFKPHVQVGEDTRKQRKRPISTGIVHRTCFWRGSGSGLFHQ